MLLVLASLLLACTPATTEPVDTGPPSLFGEDRDFDVPDGELTGVTGVVSGRIPTVVRLSWTSAEEGVGYVEHGLSDSLGVVTPAGPSGTSHDVVVLGLKAGQTHHLRAVTETVDGTRIESGLTAVELDPVPRTLGAFALTASTEEARPDGYVLTSLLQAADSWAVILDRDGDVVWYYPSTDGFSIPTTQPSLDGRSILLTQNGAEQAEDVSNIQRVPVDGGDATETRALLGHHAFVERHDGQLAWLSLDLQDVDVDGDTLTLAGDTVLVAPEGITDQDSPEELFNYFDDWGDPYRMCQHFDAEAYGTGALDWSHANSLMQLPGDDDLYLMAKNLDHVLRIDGQTGEVVWQLGGEESDVSAPADGHWWSHGHMSHLWDGGMVVFDNGYHRDPVQSRVVVYDFDVEAGTLAATWSWDDPEGRFVQILGDGRLLDNGNVLAAWTSAGIINELTPDGDVAWQLESELGTGVGRVTMLDDLYSLSGGEVE